MTRNLSILVLGLLLAGLIISGPVSAWIGDTELREIEERIEETERRLFELDKDQLLSRIDWTDWGIDLLQSDIKKMEREICKKRKKWEELRNRKMSSEEAWQEWEKAGYELDELDRKKWRLNSTLGRLKALRNKLEKRLREIRGIYEPKPFALGLGLSYLNSKNRSVQTYELKLRTPWVDVFYGANGYEEKTEKANRVSYLGTEFFLANFQFSNVMLKVPVGIEKVSFEKEITPCIGLLGELRYRTAKEELSTVFGQIRWGIKNDSIFTLSFGIFF